MVFPDYLDQGVLLHTRTPLHFICLGTTFLRTRWLQRNEKENSFYLKTSNSSSREMLRVYRSFLKSHSTSFLRNNLWTLGCKSLIFVWLLTTCAKKCEYGFPRTLKIPIISTWSLTTYLQVWMHRIWFIGFSQVSNSMYCSLQLRRHWKGSGTMLQCWSQYRTININ